MKYPFTYIVLCPKCGAERMPRRNQWTKYACGSVEGMKGGLIQSDKCKQNAKK